MGGPPLGVRVHRADDGLPLFFQPSTFSAVPFGDQVIDLLAGLSQAVLLQSFESGIFHGFELDIFEHISLDIAQQTNDLVAREGAKFPRLQPYNEFPQADEFFHTPMFV